ncbi:MAG: copper amine oxidase N-terminal domain-containing protein [Bacillota bacterium]
MKKKVFGLLFLVFVLGSLLVLQIAYAGHALQSIAVDFYAVKKIIIDNVDKTPRDKKPFVYNGTTYVPLRYVAEAFGKEVKWDGTTGTIYIGGTPDQVRTSEIYDDFSQPLSRNWDVSKQIGNWSIDPNNGAYGSGYESFLPLHEKYLIPENYTIECEICSSTYDGLIRGAGIFLKGKRDFRQRYFIKFSYWRSEISSSDDHHLYLPIEEGKFHKVKIVVNDKTVDIYLDGKFVFSDIIPDEDIQGNVLGLVSDGKGGYIKNFRIVM